MPLLEICYFRRKFSLSISIALIVKAQARAGIPCSKVGAHGNVNEKSLYWLHYR